MADSPKSPPLPIDSSRIGNPSRRYQRIAGLRVGRGLYSGDFDRDGRIDLVLTQNDGPAKVYRNVGPERAFLSLAGLPHGTRVTIELADGTTRVREAGGQTSYLGVCEEAVHVGLGSADITGIRIRPPGESEVELVSHTRRPTGRFEVRRTNGGFELFEL